MRTVKKFAWLLPLSLVIALVVDRFFLLKNFLFKVTDDDQALLAYSVQDYLHFYFREPHFYGQSYGNTFEGFLAAFLFWGKVSPHVALTFVSTTLSVLPFLLFAWIAWKKSPSLSIVILMIPLLMTQEYAVISSMPRGIVPGIFLGALAVFLESLDARIWTHVLSGFFFAIGLTFNFGSALLILPALLTVTLRRSLITGLMSGFFCYSLAQTFYRLNPGYALHPSPPLEFHSNLIWKGLALRSQFFDYFGPYFFPQAGVFLIALFVAGLILIGWHKTSVRIAAGAGLVLLLASLGLVKSYDGTPSLFFHWSRVFLAAPVLLGYFLVCLSDLAKEKRFAAGALVVLSLGLFLMKPPFSYPPPTLPYSPVGTIEMAQAEERCAYYEKLAKSSQADLIVFLRNRTEAYACGALLYGKEETLYPEYDRRTWILAQENRRIRQKVLLVDPDALFCTHAPASRSCTALEPTGRIIALDPGQPIIPMLNQMGYKIRTF